ncbi:related to D-mandelate dehydrogenase [Fusarium torulosum]|uniref:Related to D-mandelate dehydrogenase n=1 Tax=Fusarium torulosum TaxID=33205 RepID=A0AAE8SM16_9HYPO|nr:related to D-mandelate dehydrogenase [Fusarium torulosum]
MLPITTCFVAGLQYLIHPLKLGTIQETINPDALIPVTLLTTEELFGDLEGILDLFDSYDDVFVPEFGSILVEKTGDNSSQVQGNTRQVYHMDQVKALDGFSELPSGPYFLYGPNLHQAWRLYDDELGAFTFGIVPDDLGKPDEFQPLTSASVLGDSVTVPVPSRLYHPRPSPQKPLSGMRVSISDTISVKGTHTTFSSRAWKSLYKEASSNTAKYAQTLLDQGAVIIGKTKTSQFGTGAEWIDQQAPWSARGDGYNSMKGGSVGAAAALVGYLWLDYSIGTDDGRVVSEDGVYSLSQPANLSSDHVITTSKFDKTRLFSRTLKGLLDFTASSKGELLENASPIKVVVPVDLKSPDKTQGKAVDDFVSILEDHLNVKADRIDVGKAWNQNPPAEASKEAMQTYMSQAPFRSWCYDYYHAFDDFRDEYRKKFYNEPFAEATPQYFWNQCKTVTEEEHRKDTDRVEIYRRWFDGNIMRSSTPNAKSDAIVILPCGNPKVEHRNEPVAPPAIYEGIDSTTLAPVLGGSVLSFPCKSTVHFTQVPFKSAISGRTEYKPVCISVLSIQGNDKLVVQLIQKALVKKRIPTEVEIGRFTFPVKEADHLSSHLQSPLLVQD